MLVFPYIVMFLFQKSERETRSWLGTGFDTDQELLRVMRAGQMSDTPVGRYLKGLRTSYQPEAMAACVEQPVASQRIAGCVPREIGRRSAVSPVS